MIYTGIIECTKQVINMVLNTITEFGISKRDKHLVLDVKKRKLIKTFQ